ncbi:MAG: hypothetical protein KQH53_02130 [Desulfarculaceae bacterium]|nr:hypothetical protein [Desulfarculaceae bacterium]
MPCPACRSDRFYVKDPDDPYEIWEFAVHGGAPVFEEPQNDAPQIDEESQVYCGHCSWHGRLNQVS